MAATVALAEGAEQPPDYWEVTAGGVVPGKWASDDWGWQCRIARPLELERPYTPHTPHPPHLPRTSQALHTPSQPNASATMAATMALHCIGDASRDLGEPSFLGWVESANMRGPAATVASRTRLPHTVNGSRRLRLELRWHIPLWLVDGGALRARVHHLGTSWWWYEQWRDKPASLVQGLGREVQGPGHEAYQQRRPQDEAQAGPEAGWTSGRSRFPAPSAGALLASAALPVCRGTTSQANGVWLRTRSCDAEHLICAPSFFRAVRVALPCRPQRDSLAFASSDPTCPTESIPTVGLVWAPPDCKEPPMTPAQLSALAALQPELTLAFLGDSTVRYLFHHTMTVLDGASRFSYIGPPNSSHMYDRPIFHPSRRYSSIRLGFAPVLPPPLTAAEPPSPRHYLSLWLGGVLAAIQRSPAHVVYFQLSEAHAATKWKPPWKPADSGQGGASANANAELDRWVRAAPHELRDAIAHFFSRVENHLLTHPARTVVWGSPLANHNGHRLCEATVAAVVTPLAEALAHRQPGRFLFLDRFHSSEIRPEETMGDGTHYGAGHANRILSKAAAASRTAVACLGPMERTFACRKNRTCACSVEGRDVIQQWGHGEWGFGPMVYERPVVVTHAHMLLGMVLRARRARAMARGRAPSRHSTA